MSLVNSSVNRLFTARSLQIALEPVAVPCRPARWPCSRRSCRPACRRGPGRRTGSAASAVSSTASTSSTSTPPQPLPGATGCFGPRIAWPHACSRPEPPRGLLISTTNPAAAWNCASSKNVSPYCVCGPPWTLSDHRIALRRVEVDGAHDPRVDLVAAVGARHGEALPRERSHDGRVRGGERRQPARRCRRRATNTSVTWSTDDAQNATVPPRASNALTAMAPAVTFVGCGAVGGDAPQVGLAAVLGRCRAASCASTQIGVHGAGGGIERAVEPVADPAMWRHRRAGTSPTLAFCGSVLRVVVPEERDRRAVGATPQDGRRCPSGA